MLVFILYFNLKICYNHGMEEKFHKAYYKNPLALAFLGDSIFGLLVKKHLVENSDILPNALNRAANQVVCAKAQAVLLDEIKGELTDDELDIITRARNHSPHSKAKNSTVEEYNKATQLEALFGYWFLKEDYARLEKIFKKYVVEKL